MEALLVSCCWLFMSLATSATATSVESPAYLVNLSHEVTSKGARLSTSLTCSSVYIPPEPLAKSLTTLSSM